MKKVLICLIFVMVIAGLSCQTAPTQSGSGTSSGTGRGSDSVPATSGARIDGPVTQETVDRALHEIYETYHSALDMTGAQEYIVQRGDTLSEITRRFYGNLTNVGSAG